jgi:hypothetical protein
MTSLHSSLDEDQFSDDGIFEEITDGFSDRLSDRFSDEGSDRFSDEGSDRFSDEGSDRFSDEITDGFSERDLDRNVSPVRYVSPQVHSAQPNFFPDSDNLDATISARSELQSSSLSSQQNVFPDSSRIAKEIDARSARGSYDPDEFFDEIKTSGASEAPLNVSYVSPVYSRSEQLARQRSSPQRSIQRSSQRLPQRLLQRSPQISPRSLPQRRTRQMCIFREDEHSVSRECYKYYDFNEFTGDELKAFANLVDVPISRLSSRKSIIKQIEDWRETQL